jgi:hypothetical protein
VRPLSQLARHEMSEENSMTQIEALQATRRILVDSGWNRGLSTGINGEVCIEAAVALATGGSIPSGWEIIHTSAGVKLIGLLYEQIALRGEAWVTTDDGRAAASDQIWRWNDHVARDIQSVFAIIDGAIGVLRGQLWVAPKPADPQPDPIWEQIIVAATGLPSSWFADEREKVFDGCG